MHTDASLWRRLEFRVGGRALRISTLDRYIFREIMQPFLVSLFFFTSIFLSIALKDVVGDMLAKGVDPGKIFLFLGNLILEKMNMTLPFACLMSGILAAGRLSGDSEITAMRAAGISFPRMYVVFLFVGLLSALVMMIMMAFIGPASARAREDFQNWLKSYHSLTMVQTGRFLGRGDFDGSTVSGQDIYAERRRGNRLENVHIRKWYTEIDPEKPNVIQVMGGSLPLGRGVITQMIQAESGELVTRRNSEGAEERLLRLERGFTIELDPEDSAYQVTSFQNGRMDYVVPPPPKQLGRIDVRPDNFTTPQLLGRIQELDEGGMKINPLMLLGPMVSQMRNYNGLVGVNPEDADPTALGIPAEIVLPSIERMEAVHKQLEMVIILGGDVNSVPMPEELANVPPEMRTTFMMMLKTFVDDAKKTRRKFAYEVQRRLATPAACMLFFFISFPLGLVVKRSGKGMSFVLALVVFVGYYLLIKLAGDAADAGRLNEYAAAWLPIVGLAFFGAYIMASRTDGRSPLAFVLRPLGKALAWIFRPITRRFAPGTRGGALLDGLAASGPVRALGRAIEALRDAPGRIRDWLERRARSSAAGPGN